MIIRLLLSSKKRKLKGMSMPVLGHARWKKDSYPPGQRRSHYPIQLPSPLLGAHEISDMQGEWVLEISDVALSLYLLMLSCALEFLSG